MTDYQTAADQMCALFRDRWAALAPAIVGLVPHVVYPDDTVPFIDDASVYWARISMREVNSFQASYRGPQSSPRRWRIEGLVTVQCFAPMVDNLGSRNNNALATIARNTFRGEKAGECVWFRRPRIARLDPDGKWHRSNAIAVYEYDDIR